VDEGIVVRYRHRLTNLREYGPTRSHYHRGIVTYQSFLRWVREAEAGQTAKAATPKRKPGRPRKYDDIPDLVLKWARKIEWACTRILGEGNVDVGGLTSGCPDIT
jgi:hypothetical protein